MSTRPCNRAPSAMTNRGTATAPSTEPVSPMPHPLACLDGPAHLAENYDRLRRQSTPFAELDVELERIDESAEVYVAGRAWRSD